MSEKVAYLGPKATFTHEAAVKYFGYNKSYIPIKRISGIFEAVLEGSVDFGVVPVENSTGGSVTDTLDLFIKTDLKVYDRITLKVKHNLLARCPRGEIKRVYAHPQALIQCSEYLQQNFPEAEQVASLSNAEGVLIAKKEGGSAGIGSILCVNEYSLDIIDKEINDNKENETRFYIISREKHRLLKSRSLILLSVKNEVGSLYDILKIFKKSKINMTRIESRPSRVKNWDYVFIVEYENSSCIKRNRKLLHKLKRHCNFVDYLGSY